MELIKITEQNGKKVVSARELHSFLEVETPLITWAKRMFEYGFIENVDFQRINKSVLTPNGGEREALDDYALTFEMAKHLAMIQRSDKGMQARNYFIECEKQLQKPMSQLEILVQSVRLLEEQSKRIDSVEAKILDFSALQDGSDLRAGCRDYSGNNRHGEIMNLPAGTVQQKVDYANANLFVPFLS